MKKILYIITIILCLCFLASCETGDDSPDTQPVVPQPTQPVTTPEPTKPNDPTIGFAENDTYHYLVFVANGADVIWMYVNETDTYDTIKDFIPKCPDMTSDGLVFAGTWKIDQNTKIYDSEEKIIYITAHYTVKD